AQWEYACRATTTTPFHFGGVLNSNLANCDGNYPFGTNMKGPYIQRPTRVDGVGEKYQYPPNPWGLSDMHGNVWQWCEDAYDKNFYKKAEPEAPFNPGNATSAHVPRGGSWCGPARYCRSAYRGSAGPDNCPDDIGFRVACLPPHPLDEPSMRVRPR